VPTAYGEAFRRRGLAAFDELKQGVRDIEFLADPTRGELRMGCDESIAAATLPRIIQRFYEQFPGGVLDAVTRRKYVNGDLILLSLDFAPT
jgi:DNA-binding transcriptional LysR family regulator